MVKHLTGDKEVSERNKKAGEIAFEKARLHKRSIIKIAPLLPAGWLPLR